MSIKNPTNAEQTTPSAVGVAGMCRWFFTRRRLALFLIIAVGLTTPVLLALNWNHKLFFITLELSTKFLIIYPAIRANCGWFGPVVTRFRTREKAVWLTIDDGPHPEDTPQLLALLKKHSARATFLSSVGRCKKSRTGAGDFARRTFAGQPHPNHPILTFWSFPETPLAREIESRQPDVARSDRRTGPLVSRAGRHGQLFVHYLLRDRGMKLIGWSARGFDGLFHDPDAMANRICKSIQPGTIILLHEGRRDRRARPINLILAETVLTRLGAAGYVFIVPDEKDFL